MVDRNGPKEITYQFIFVFGGEGKGATEKEIIRSGGGRGGGGNEPIWRENKQLIDQMILKKGF